MLIQLTKHFNKFMDVKKSEGLAKGTIKQYESNYRYFVEYLDAKNIDHKLTAINKSTLRGYVSFMLHEKKNFDGHKYKQEKYQTVGLSPVTVNTRMKSLRVLFRYLENEGLIKSNPLDEISNVKEPKEAIQVMNEDELYRILNAPDRRRYSDFRDYVLMNLLLDGMLRISEATTLTVYDVDFKDCFVNIRAINAKSRKSHMIPLQRRTIKLIRELISENKQDFDSDFIFLTNYGEPIDRNLFNKRLKIYTKRAGIKKNIHPHLFRHTSATMFLESGGDIRHLQLLLGHSDVRMVMRYTHISNQSLKTQHEKHSALNQVIDKRSRQRKILR